MRVIGFSGQIASGKTTISRASAKLLGWRWFGFGQYLRQKAKDAGLDAGNRCILKELGKDAIDLGWERFCSNVLAAAGWQSGEGLVLDGIRHIEAVRTLEKLVSPLKVNLVFVSTAEAVRKSRLRARGLGGDIRELDADALEAQVLSVLSSQSDFTVDGSLSPHDCASRLQKWLASSDATPDHTRSNDAAAHILPSREK